MRRRAELTSGESRSSSPLDRYSEPAAAIRRAVAGRPVVTRPRVAQVVAARAIRSSGDVVERTVRVRPSVAGRRAVAGKRINTRDDRRRYAGADERAPGRTRSPAGAAESIVNSYPGAR